MRSLIWRSNACDSERRYLISHLPLYGLWLHRAYTILDVFPPVPAATNLITVGTPASEALCAWDSISHRKISFSLIIKYVYRVLFRWQHQANGAKGVRSADGVPNARDAMVRKETYTIYNWQLSNSARCYFGRFAFTFCDAAVRFLCHRRWAMHSPIKKSNSVSMSIDRSLGISIP